MLDGFVAAFNFNKGNPLREITNEELYQLVISNGYVEDTSHPFCNDCHVYHIPDIEESLVYWPKDDKGLSTSRTRRNMLYTICLTLRKFPENLIENAYTEV